jgi:metal-responsive CopG/Arc/MetJ family transcriptional regulator
MKIKTAVALSEDLLSEIDERTRTSGQDRSELIEAAVRAFITEPGPAKADSRDLEIIEENAERLNLEAEDVLSYQVVP